MKTLHYTLTIALIAVVTFVANADTVEFKDNNKKAAYFAERELRVILQAASADDEIVVEEWMYNTQTWNTEVSNEEIAQDEKLELETWMLDFDEYENTAYNERDEKLTIEQWMFQF
jgi:hypothetical protein